MEKTLPLISVIVPVYKTEKYLRKCVDSIINQTYKNLEIILVDDGSPDNCPAICDEYAAKDSRIRVIHKPNGGLSSARNAGLDVCTGDYIGFVDSDDCIDFEMYEKLYSALHENNADLAICELLRCNESFSSDDFPDFCEVAKQLRVLNADEAISALASSSFIPFVVACSKLYKKDLFDTIRFPVGKLHEDAFVTHQILFKCTKVVKIPDSLYFYTINASSITRSTFTVKRFDAVEARYLRLMFYIDNGLTSHVAEAVLGIDTSYCSCVAQFHPKTEEDFCRLKEIKAMVHKARKLYNGRISVKQRVKRLFPRLFYYASSLKHRCH